MNVPRLAANATLFIVQRSGQGGELGFCVGYTAISRLGLGCSPNVYPKKCIDFHFFNSG